MTAAASYDILQLSIHLDWINLKLNRNTRCGCTSVINSHFPCNLDYDPNDLDVRGVVDYWIEKGAVPEKLVLGMMTHGRINDLNSEFIAHLFPAGILNSNTPPSSTSGGGMNFHGLFTFDKVCRIVDYYRFKVVRRNQNNIDSYAIKSKNQGLELTHVKDIRAKAKLICEMNLGGGLFWSLQHDDFEGYCGCGTYPLITALNQEIRGILRC